MEPIEIKALNPTFSRKLQSKMDVQSAPLWLINPTLPERAMALEKVALSPEWGFIKPKQFMPQRNFELSSAEGFCQRFREFRLRQ
jgi:hypothetical protein